MVRCLRILLLLVTDSLTAIIAKEWGKTYFLNEKQSVTHR